MAIFYLLAISVAVILLYKIAVLFYEDYIMRKKLSHIPGLVSFPLIGTLSSTFSFLQKKKDRIQWFMSQLDKFKDGIFLFWAGPRPLICLYKPEMIKAILSSSMHINKSKSYDLYKHWLGTGLVTSEDKQWFRDRKLLSPMLHFNVLEQFGVIMSEKTELLLKKLENEIAENPGKFINIAPIIDNVTLEITFDTIMGINVHTSEAKANYVNCTQKLLQLISLRTSQPLFWIDWIYNLFQAGREYKKTLREMKEFTKYIIQKRQFARKIQNGKSQNNDNDFEMAAKPREKPILELLLELNENENNLLSDEDLISHVDTFMFAAYDTTSTTLNWVLYCLGSNLEHQEKVHEEIDQVFQDSQSPATMKELSQLKYLDRVMKESIRLYPTVPLIARRIMRDTNIDGYVIPKNITVLLSIILLHRNPSVWPDPLKFDPDRFLPENTRRMHPYAFIPFSAGPRNCIGQRVALLEEKMLLTAVLRKWRIKSMEEPTELNLCDNVLRPQHGAFYMYLSPKQ
ncbi:cytochrome P450 4c21-like [Odontomachus brunneus]|uniref:cytochrome P450 4c21-like n=1 Tax=Odontomachus brunneus TaxID=486640 RepID=UPI0013F1FC3C|nr:cytochrome P450 4c21-like [Odontomachus brunneus]